MKIILPFVLFAVLLSASYTLSAQQASVTYAVNHSTAPVASVNSIHCSISNGRVLLKWNISNNHEADQFEEALELVNTTSPYALTGAVIAQDRAAVELATKKLRHAAGNFYINDKPTGAVVGQQPFGGARASGTNDKAGAKVNLLRWVSMRTIKETFVPATDYRYPFLEKE